MKGKILVVDDEEAVGRFVEKVLVKMGYEVFRAEDAKGAIKLLHEQKFHAVITDKNMPGTTHSSEGGLDVLQESKAINPSCGVLMMTAYATMDSALEAMRLGVFDYIQKPFMADDIRCKVDRIVELQRSLDPIGNIASYNELRQEFFTLFSTQHRQANPEEAQEKFLEKIQETLDTVFQERRNVERTLIEQRDALNTIASLAAQLSDSVGDNEEIKSLVAEIAKQAEHRI